MYSTTLVFPKKLNLHRDSFSRWCLELNQNKEIILAKLSQRASPTLSGRSELESASMSAGVAYLHISRPVAARTHSDCLPTNSGFLLTWSCTRWKIFFENPPVLLQSSSKSKRHVLKYKKTGLGSFSFRHLLRVCRSDSFRARKFGLKFGDERSELDFHPEPICESVGGKMGVSKEISRLGRRR